MNLKEITELAKKIDRHPTTVFRWFQRSRGISNEDAVRLEEATGIDRRAWIWPDEFPNPILEKHKTSALSSPTDA